MQVTARGTHPANDHAARRLPPSAPDEPVLLVGAEPWWDTTLLPFLGSAGWNWIIAEDVDRARWLAAIRRVSLVLVAGDRAFRWRVVDTVRDCADAPLGVVADDPDEVVDLVAAGVDFVVGSAEPGAVVLARAGAVIRRSDVRRGPGVRYLKAEDLVVDLWTQQCTRRGKPLAFSPIEYHLLTFLMTRPAVTLSPRTIISKVWGHTPGDGRNALRIVVNRVRRKLHDDPKAPVFIAAVRGIGYRFVANVADVADSEVDHAGGADVTPLLDSIGTFARRLAECDGPAAAARELLDAIDAAGLADGMATFRNDGPRMRLVAALRMPDAWLDAVADGVPLDPSFASAQSVLIGEVVQFADVREMKEQFAATATQLSGDGFRACHFVPIARGDEAWGHLGLARRSPSPLDDVTMAYLRALCTTFLLRISPPVHARR